MASTKDWIQAARLRTLPLAFAVVLMGSGLAYFRGAWDWLTFGLTLLTTFLLQILSNLANDYGDSQHGADSAARKGPSRLVQSGIISAKQMKQAMFQMAGLSLISGLALLVYSLWGQWLMFGVFLAVGLGGILAAVAYTNGSRPYGYAGFGDLFVFLFFGWVGVLGTAFLQSQALQWPDLLPASALGFLSTAVLNVNNIRDIASDKEAGKLSIPVRLGRTRAVFYHAFLLLAPFLTLLAFNWLEQLLWYYYAFLLALPLMAINLRAVALKKEASQLDPFLRQLAISTLIFVLLNVGLWWVKPF